MFSLIGIDPGANTIGVSIMIIDKYTLLPVEIITETIDVSKVESITENNYAVNYKLDLLYHRLLELFNRYNPIAVSIENPFLNTRFPGAVVPLGKSLGVIEMACTDFNPYMLVRRISPSEGKNAIGAKGNADKEVMYNALINHEISQYINFNTITEHEVDATAFVVDLHRELIKAPHLFLHL